MAISNVNEADPHTAWKETDVSPISILDEIRNRGRTWEDLAAQYGVTNPDPPWRITMDATCEMLAADSCIKPHDRFNPTTCVLPKLEMRAEEDDLVDTIYADVPFPERTLLALAHSMMTRGLFNEEELSHRMEEIERRLNSA